MTNEDHFNDKSSDEDTQNGQCDFNLHDMFNTHGIQSIESFCLTTKNIRCAGPYLSWYKVQEIIVMVLHSRTAVFLNISF